MITATANQSNYVLNSNETITNNKSYGSDGRTFFNNVLLNAGTYTISYIPNLSGTTKNIRFSIKNIDSSTDIINQSISITNETKQTFSFTLSSNTNIAICIMANGANDGIITLKNIKLQKGTVATPYSPYNQGTVTIKQRGITESNDYTIQTEPLRSLPNGVKDTIEADGIHRRVGRVVLDGTEDWYKRTDYYFENHTVFRNNSNKIHFIGNGYGLSNYFEVKQTQSEDNQIRLSSALTYGAQITTANNIASTPQELKTWLSTHNTEVIYELEEEIIEPLTQNQATTMLDIIKTGSYEGTTNIYTDEDVKVDFLQ